MGQGAILLALVACSRATTRGGAARAHVRMAARGFGAAKPEKGRRTEEGSATQPALDCLRRADGDLDRAQSLYFADAARALRTREPQAFERLVAFKQSHAAAAPTSGAAHVGESDAGAHELLLELTWDSVAAFMPEAQRPTREIEGRLRRIAHAATDGLGPVSGTLLDVGCGDGALVPHVAAAAACDYVGIDLSSVMVARARRAHPAARFERRSFSAWAERPGAPRCASIVFNGALQFFADQKATLALAAAHLAPGAPHACERHVRIGAAARFVASERARFLPLPPTARAARPQRAASWSRTCTAPSLCAQSTRAIGRSLSPRLSLIHI